MPSTVNSCCCVELRDGDLDRLDISSNGSVSTGSEVENAGKIGDGVEIGTGGGNLLGGEPDSSGFVARKNSAVEPALLLYQKETIE